MFCSCHAVRIVLPTSARDTDQRTDTILEVRRRAVRFVLATSTRDTDPRADKFLKSGQGPKNARADKRLEAGVRRASARVETVRAFVLNNHTRTASFRIL